MLVSIAGNNNTAVGYQTMSNAPDPTDCVAIGNGSLGNMAAGGARNTAVGSNTGIVLNGTGNTFLGYATGIAVVNCVSSIYINNIGTNNDNGVIRIGTLGTQNKNFQAGIRGIATDIADAVPVLIDSAGQLGTVSSSERYKKDIRDMTDADIEFLSKIRPVKYKWDDKNGLPRSSDTREQPGLIAEQVYDVDPFYISRNGYGLIDTVKYHEMITPLIAWVQKLAARVEQLEAVVAERI